MAKSTLKLRVICLQPPPLSIQGHILQFGLQDKKGQVYPAVSQTHNSATFECSVDVQDVSAEQPNFLGAFTHGTPTVRFLYLTYQHGDRDDKHIIKRLKIHLKSITSQQIQEAIAQGKHLQVSVDGQEAASVHLSGEGWQVE